MPCRLPSFSADNRQTCDPIAGVRVALPVLVLRSSCALMRYATSPDHKLSYMVHLRPACLGVTAMMLIGAAQHDVLAKIPRPRLLAADVWIEAMRGGPDHVTSSSMASIPVTAGVIVWVLALLRFFKLP